MIKSATKTLMQGNQVLVNLENSSFNNCSIEDELSNFKIGHVKLSVYKILKIGIRIQSIGLNKIPITFYFLMIRTKNVQAIMLNHCRKTIVISNL